MIEYFVRPMDGITQRFSFDELIAYRSSSGMKFRTRPPGTVVGPIGSGALDLPLACARARALASKPFKFTVTGPHMLAKTLIDRHYGNLPDLANAIADALAEQVRHCEAESCSSTRRTCPPSRRVGVGRRGDQPRARRGAGQGAVHLCFGNYGGQSVQKGTWDRLMRYLNALHADHVVMEVAHRPPEELAAFKELKPGIGFGLGVVDIKANEVESPEQIARAIERAEKTLGAGRVRYVHPDCGFWMLKRPIADAKIRAMRRGGTCTSGRARVTGGLPAGFADEAALEDFMTAPSPALSPPTSRARRATSWCSASAARWARRSRAWPGARRPTGA